MTCLLDKKYKYNFFEFFFYLFCFFPYLKIIPIASDTQPYAFLVSVLFLIIELPEIYHKKIISKNILISLFIAVILGIANFSFTVVRDLFGYFSMFVIYAEALYIFSRFGFNKKLFHLFSIIWAFVGVVQLFYPSFLTFLVSSSRTSSNRGVCSLAVEPSYFGIVLQFFILINILCKGDKRYNILYGVSIVLLSRSAMSIAYLFVFILLYLLKYKHMVLLYFFFILLYFVLYFSNSFAFLESNSNARAIRVLLRLLKEGPYILVKSDWSINDRIGAIYFSIKGAFDNFFVPHSFGYWAEYLGNELPRQTYFYRLTNHRILCTIGSIIFYEGVFGLFLVYKLFADIKNIQSKNNRFLFMSFLLLFFLTAIPLAFPLLPFMCAMLNSCKEISERDV